MREVQTLRAREHPHIVPLLASFTENSLESGFGVRILNLLFPLSEMDMQQWLNLKEPPAYRTDLLQRGRQQFKTYIYHSTSCLCSGFAYLHREIGGLISSHHDLKPKNILWYGQTWKIADLGRTHLIALEGQSDTEALSGLGTFAYNPPEYWTDKGHRANIRHGRAFDIWSLGCVFLELMIIATYGWSSEGLPRFRKDRLTNRKRLRTFEKHKSEEDDSFHNNLNIVEAWLSQLQTIDKSNDTQQLLNIVRSMLDVDQHKRPLSWEIELDLFELMNPDANDEEKMARTVDLIQCPSPLDTARQSPLERAAIQANMVRVNCLLQSKLDPWKVDTVSVISKSSASTDDLQCVIQTLELARQQSSLAKATQRLSQRRAVRQANERKAQTLTQISIGEVPNSHEPRALQVTDTEPRRYAANRFQDSEAASSEMRMHGGVGKLSYEQPGANGMTPLHRACRESSF